MYCVRVDYCGLSRAVTSDRLLKQATFPTVHVPFAGKTFASKIKSTFSFERVDTAAESSEDTRLRVDQQLDCLSTIGLQSKTIMSDQLLPTDSPYHQSTTP
jgi:hypothetical protein